MTLRSPIVAIAGIAAAGILVAAVIAMWPPSEPADDVVATSAVPGPIVYARDVAGETQLVVLMPDGAEAILPNTQGARGARWSPDATMLAFGRFGEGIFVVNQDGSGLRRVVAAPAGVDSGQPIWSPDGRRLAYTVGDGSIEIVDPQTGIRKRLPTRLASVWEWLPDGTFLGSSVRPAGADSREEIAEHRTDGSFSFLTNTANYQEGVPRLSPDGTSIVFLSSDWLLVDGTRIVGEVRIGVMRRDGTDAFRITTTNGQVTWPAWSPDGREIVYGPVPTAIRPDGTGKRVLSGGGHGEDGFDWAPLVGAGTP